MLKRILNSLVLLAFMAGLLAVTPVTQASASADSKGISPEGMLNPDGTLKLGENFKGTLSLDGYNVQLDPALGPVFSPIASQDNWAAVGSGGGAFQDAVYTILVNGTDIYVGGVFKNAGGDPTADYIAKWNGSTWTALGHNGSGNGALSGGGGSVNALFMYGGNLYVGGSFGSVYDTSGGVISNASRIAVWNGSVWTALPGISPALNNAVQTLAFDATNNILYFGGSFTDANGNGAADRIAGMDLDTSTLVTLGSNGGGDGSLNNTVYTIGLDSLGNMYAGGFFFDVNNGGTTLTEADYIAKWDGVNWSALGNNGAGVGAMNAMVVSLAIDGSDNVYAGGSFTNAAGIAEADYVARWNGSSWSALGSNGSGNGALVSASGGTVIQEITINGTDVYVGGFFTGGAGIPTADYAARFDTNTNSWHSLGNNGSGNGSLNFGVVGMTFSGGSLYLGGAFANVNYGGLVLPTADYFASWDGSNWSTLGDSNGPISNNVQALTVIGSDVYVGGMFADLGGDPRIDCLARWDGSTWNPVGNITKTSSSLGNGCWVLAMAADGTDLYVGGYFSSAQNEGVSVPDTSYIAKWNGSVWSSLGGGLNSGVQSLAVDSSHNVYAGGNFTNAAGIPEADYIAKWNGSSWSSLAGNGASNGALNNAAWAITVNGSDVYVGGNFSSVVDTSNTAIPNAAYLAKWNGSAWSAMDGITSPLSLWVDALTISGSDLYVGGGFGNLNGMNAADYIAKWNGSTWSALGSGVGGDGSLPSSVYSIAVIGNNVYVGGQFLYVNNGATSIPAARYAAKWNGSSWSALGNDGGAGGSLNWYVRALKIVDRDLWVGGEFTNVNNGGTVIKEADYLATYGLDSTPPAIVSILRANTTPTTASSVNFNVSFTEPVTGVDVSDFALDTSGVSGSAVSGISGSGAAYTVTVSGISGTGTVSIDFVDDDTVIDGFLNPAGGTGAGNGSFTAGLVYDVDNINPTVLSITRANPNPTASSSVDFTVTFSETVVGVEVFDFSLASSGISGASITGVVGSTNVYTVTVDTGLGNGTLGLNLVDDDSISDNYLNKLGGTGAINGDFTGEVYTVTKTAPALILPTNGEVLHNLRPSFDWSNYAGAKGYQIQISKKPNFSINLVNALVNGPTNSQYNTTKDLPANSLLYWRVRAKLSATQYSAWSTAFTFTTPNPPSIPVLVSPANNALVQTPFVTLDWNDSVLPGGSALAYYQIQIDDAADFLTVLTDVNSGSSSYLAGSFSPNTKYYWRVRAWNTNGDSSAWSAPRSFREAITAPFLLSPIGGVTVGSLKPTFDWSDVVGATGYTIQVSLSNTFNSFAINVTINTATSQYISGVNLQAGKTYYWRVRANGPNGPSVWSVVETFLTP